MKQAIRYALIAFYAVAVLAPIWIFFSLRGGLSILQVSDYGQLASILYPLDGLMAFSFVAMQALIGSNMLRLRLIFKRIMNFHRLQGVLALFFILLHPAMIITTFGLGNTLSRNVVAPEQEIYILLAQVALVIVLTTISTAIIAWKLQKLPGTWRQIHKLNYLVFPLAWTHSWFVGSDVQTTNLKYLWILYMAIFIPSVIQRFRTGKTA